MTWVLGEPVQDGAEGGEGEGSGGYAPEELAKDCNRKD
jgi:hypothetical protein